MLVEKIFDNVKLCCTELEDMRLFVAIKDKFLE